MSVIKAIEFPDEEFSSKEELFKSLKENAEKIIELKKAEIRKSDSVKMTPFKKTDAVSKELNLEEGFVYPVINTTKYMDSHNDVHLDGIWNRTIKEQKGKIYYVANHQLDIGKVIAYPKDVAVSVQNIAWKDLGANYTGETQALIFKVAKDKIKLQEAKDIIEEKIDIEHSVRMQYVKVELAVNSEEDEFKAEKKVYDKHIDVIVNQDVVEEKGYFWAVPEAKISREGSMVLDGSNDVTPMLHSKNIQPSNDIEDTDPSNDIPRTNKKYY